MHWDYRLDNTILDTSHHGRVAAIIDWEMATLGDPLADLSLLLTYWSPLSAAVTGGSGHPASANPGFPASDHLISCYQHACGEICRRHRLVHRIRALQAGRHCPDDTRRYLQGFTVGSGFEAPGCRDPRARASRTAAASPLNAPRSRYAER